MKVGILGTPVSSGNRGVMALGAALVSLLSRAGAAHCTMFVGHARPDPLRVWSSQGIRVVEVVNYRLSPKARPKEHLAWIVCASLLYAALPLERVRAWLQAGCPWIKKLTEMDVVGDIRGGDSFSDIYGMRRFLLGFLAAWTVILVGKPLVMFPQTYGPYRHPIARWLARYLLRRARVILARDAESQRVANEWIGPHRSAWLTPDVAFALEARLPKRLELSPPLNLGHGCSAVAGVRPIGLNINGLMYNGGYTRRNQFGLQLDYRSFLPKLVTALLQEHPGEIWLIPHTYAPPESVESDPEACRRVQEAMPVELKGRIRVVTGEYDCHEIKGVIGLCDFMIGSRMHACIAALSQGIPTVGIAYSRKFEGVFETVGMREWVVDARKLEESKALQRVLELYRRREEVRAGLSARAGEARRSLEEAFQQFIVCAIRTGAGLHENTDACWRPDAPSSAVSPKGGEMQRRAPC
ncbi:MAG: polysaccharide pyruvyl transferase family protein [Verrucomicrobiota bacterium]|nr:polysaccharide pyruvyl transferase family protein [Limisphaera sp.]MDW8380809.1 polysaccharide pyruvyl transferase family protein [Verrucomicrobiota bacterium]